MDLTHWVLVGILLLSVLIAVGGFVWMSRILGKDALVARMDKLREKIGPIGVRVAGLVREGDADSTPLHRRGRVGCAQMAVGR